MGSYSLLQLWHSFIEVQSYFAFSEEPLVFQRDLVSAYKRPETKQLQTVLPNLKLV